MRLLSSSFCDLSKVFSCFKIAISRSIFVVLFRLVSSSVFCFTSASSSFSFVAFTKLVNSLILFMCSFSSFSFSSPVFFFKEVNFSFKSLISFEVLFRISSFLFFSFWSRSSFDCKLLSKSTTFSFKLSFSAWRSLRFFSYFSTLSLYAMLCSLSCELISCLVSFSRCA